MRVWLDDERPAPKGWRLVKSPTDAIDLIQLGHVSEVSLDHDLGDDVVGNGYDVLRWLESSVYTSLSHGVPLDFSPPAIRIHTANPVARARMEQALRSIKKGLKQLSERDS